MKVRVGEVVSTCIAATVASSVEASDWHICGTLGSVNAVVQLRLIDNIVQSKLSCVHTGIMFRLFTKRMTLFFPSLDVQTDIIMILFLIIFSQL